MSAIARDFFDRPVLTVARELLGRTIVHDGPEGRVAVRLTEVEAYDGPNDPGSHAYRKRTARNETMYGPPGHVYVYFTYGMYYCANLVCGPVGQPSGVLLRAGEVVAGVDLARSRRGAATSDRDLARGPARLAMALGLGREDDGADACGTGPIMVLGDDEPGIRVGSGDVGKSDSHNHEAAVPVVRTGPRVGLTGAADWPWRFWLDGEPSVSVYRPAKPRRARGGAPGPAPAAPDPESIPDAEPQPEPAR